MIVLFYNYSPVITYSLVTFRSEKALKKRTPWKAYTNIQLPFFKHQNFNFPDFFFLAFKWSIMKFLCKLQHVFKRLIFLTQIVGHFYKWVFNLFSLLLQSFSVTLGNSLQRQADLSVQANTILCPCKSRWLDQVTKLLTLPSSTFLLSYKFCYFFTCNKVIFLFTFSIKYQCKKAS